MMMKCRRQGNIYSIYIFIGQKVMVAFIESYPILTAKLHGGGSFSVIGFTAYTGDSSPLIIIGKADSGKIKRTAF